MMRLIQVKNRQNKMGPTWLKKFELSLSTSVISSHRLKKSLPWIKNDRDSRWRGDRPSPRLSSSVVPAFCFSVNSIHTHHPQAHSFPPRRDKTDIHMYVWLTLGWHVRRQLMDGDVSLYASGDILSTRYSCFFRTPFNAAWLWAF